MRKTRGALYVLNFLFSLHLALVSYFMATLLVARGFPENYIGILYSVGSVITLLALGSAPYILKKFGNYTNILTLSALEFLAFVGIALSHSLLFTFIFFVTTFIVPTLIAFSLDIFLEGSTPEDTETGRIRGTFLSIAAAAWIGAPLIGGLLVQQGGYMMLFLISAFIFFPFIFIATPYLKTFNDPTYHKLNLQSIIHILKASSDMRNVFVAQFFLRVFYATMVIYFPLYIHQVLGMPLSYVGLFISIATLAFVLIEIPIGRLEDTRIGEKEVLILGFFIISISTGALTFLTTTALLIWIPIIFITRIGAAMIEVGSESYFFKHADTDDSDIISAFRMLFPIAYIIAPFLATLLLFAVPLNYIFLALGGVLITGVLFSAQLTDIHRDAQ